MRYLVKSGDSLWSIAKQHLAEARNRPSEELSNREVAAYWLKVIETNRDSLRSGDPDLIYPGEELRLPPILD